MQKKNKLLALLQYTHLKSLNEDYESQGFVTFYLLTFIRKFTVLYFLDLVTISYGAVMEKCTPTF